MSRGSVGSRGTVKLRQIELLLDYMERHRSLALGRARGKEGHVWAQRLWQSCADILNSELGGAQKSPQLWKKYYNQYKCRVKSKVRALRHGHQGPGGGTEEAVPLTPLEERLITILGGCNSPLPVKRDPIDDLDITLEHTENGSPENVIVEPIIESVDPRVPENGNIVDDVNVSPVSSPGNYNHQNVDMPEDMRNENTTPPLNENFEPVRGNRNERARRRVYHRRSSSPTTDNNVMRQARHQLAAMEQARIDVDRELVGAINRQATAIEAFVGHFKRLVDHFVQRE